MLHIPKNKVNSSCNVYLDKINTSDTIKIEQSDSEDSVNINCRTKMTSYIKFDDLVILAETEKFILVNSSAKNIRLRLCGGGEDSLNNGTSGWGQPPPIPTNNANSAWGVPANPPPSQWNNNQQNLAQRPSADQNASKPLNPSNSGPSWNQVASQNKPPMQQPINNNNLNIGNNNNQQPPQQQPPQGVNTQNPGGTSKLEHLNTMREALFSQDGWGCQNVNQDTNWDVPSSPEPPKVEPGAGGPASNIVSTFKTNNSNGTELWEANLRNGGQPAAQPQPVQKAPWGPVSNIGGTWGEDDDSNEPVATAWGNQPAAGPIPAAQPQWGHQNNSSSMWPINNANAPVKKENDWNAGVIGSNSTNANLNNWDGRGNGPAPVAAPMSQNIEPNRDIRGDPRGISGRLNGNNGMWDQHPMVNMAANKLPQSGPSPANGQWPNQQIPIPPNPSVNPAPGVQLPKTAWDDGPAGVRGNMPVDDGPTGWNQNPLQRQNSASNWKEMPDNVIRNQMPRTAAPTNIPIGPNANMQPEWGQNPRMPGRAGSWDEQQNNQGRSFNNPGNDPNWELKNLGGDITSSWNDIGQNAWNKSKPITPIWQEHSDPLNNDWVANHSGFNKMANKINPNDFIRNSKQYKYLCDMGFKMDEVELVLRKTNLNLDESLELLQRGMDWRRHDDNMPGFDQQPQFTGRFPGGPGNSLQFPQQNNQNLLNGNIAALNNLKYMPPTSQSISSFTQPPSGINQNPQSQPSTQQLRMLVQQIQMAVQAGFLNHQILNQPLAPQTLVLLNQLLNNIKQLQVAQANSSRGGGVNNVQMILKLKSQIASLQNQIAQQQAIYIKQQGNSHINNDSMRFQNDLQALQANFNEISIKDQPPYAPGVTSQPQTGPSQQSRLNQWKLPTLDKDASNDLTDFSRAPGTTSKPTLSTTNSAMNPLGMQSDGSPIWTSNRSNITDGWPDQINESENKDWSSNQESSAFTDLVPEFEPGKPWKGTQMKIEDDPTITPGSVARSPLSIATAKDSDLFTTSSKTSPTDAINLTSSTWSFNPDNIAQTTTGSELWNPSLNKAPRAPPGLSATTKSANTGTTNSNNGNWLSSNSQRVAGNNWGGGNNQMAMHGPNWFSSSWLLLKNLTAQIDGSTLRTLCMQHADIKPLQAFHLYLNHGIALCKYATREEASKAQLALNSCVLGNTTICAETIAENEVQNILQQLGPDFIDCNPRSQSNGNGSLVAKTSDCVQHINSNAGQQWRPRTSGSDTWTSSGWPSSANASSNLWQPLDVQNERATPSNLNSFLPESLLGTELN